MSKRLSLLRHNNSIKTIRLRADSGGRKREDMKFDDVLKQEEYLFEESHDAAGSSEPACSEEKHRTMYKDGWKNCWDCGKELITPFNNPNASEQPPKVG